MNDASLTTLFKQSAIRLRGGMTQNFRSSSIRKACSLNRSHLLGMLVVFAGYFLAAKWGLQLDAVSGFATLVWAPTGIALAAVLLLGRRVWPGVFFAALAVNLSEGANFTSAFGIGIGNTLEALVGFKILNAIGGFQKNLGRQRDVVAL